jgi:hypothetical protein
MGPLIDKGAVDAVLQSIEKVKKEGGEVLYGASDSMANNILAAVT